MARFFIDRPIFAWVIAIVIMLAGVLSILSLPISQYPTIAPPTVRIRATYLGASAQTLADTVTQVIEQQMTGLDGLRYMSSSSNSAGVATITLTFNNGIDPDIAQVQAQNKLQVAMPLLPQEVQQQGVTVKKSAGNFLAVVALVSTDGTLTNKDLGDYIATNMLDPISRLPGVGEVQLFGGQYSMRIWLNPDRLNNYRLTPVEVIAAIRAQNAQVSAGQIGGAPAVEGQQINASIIAQTRLESPAEFSRILLRVNPDGSAVTLGDVARIELGGENYNILASYNGTPSAALGVMLATGANALETMNLLQARIGQLARFLPPGVEVKYPMDTTIFVRLSIASVVRTLIEAIGLVFLVMFLFLQSFRATIIPTIAVPVVLLGTFAVMAIAGFSINTLTMFGMVLAIGLLVDDAIVVVENVERVMQEEGLSPLEATRKSMDQITGALVGVALVLAAVFVPMAFYGGAVGVIYRQFSITIASAMVLSVVVAIVLTPALCATILKPIPKGHAAEKRGFFGWFNRAFARTNTWNHNFVAKMLGRTGLSMSVYVVIVALMAFVFLRLPKGFLPEEDQGLVFAQVQLPSSATLAATQGVLATVARHFLEQEKDTVDSVLTVAGFGFLGQGQNVGLAFVRLKDWSLRKTADRKAPAVAGRAMAAFAKIKEAQVFAFIPPAISELGNATGFDLQLQDLGGAGHAQLTAARNQLLGLAAKEPRLVAVRPNGLDDSAQYRVRVDQKKASAFGLSLGDINTTLSSTWGTVYVNDFIDRGRVKRVYMQADAPFRMQPADIGRWFVKNSTGQMVPFSAFASGEWTMGSPQLTRYNGLPSMEILGTAAPGESSGTAMTLMEEFATKLPGAFGIEWTGMSYEERMAGAQSLSLYGLSLLVVFLCLAALYESWSIPVSVLLIVPLGVLGAVLAVFVFHLANDVYFQVGLLTTIGLASKNAILIVEFAKEQMQAGQDPIPAALTAIHLRLRPILMTSIAFVLGVVPLALSNGAGAGSQNAIGVVVIGGMLTGTLFAITFVPVFFVVVTRLLRKRRPAVVNSRTIAASGS